MSAPASTNLSVRTEELKSCIGCGGARLKVWCKGRDRLHGITAQEFLYSRCRDCGLIFLTLRPLEEEIHKFYPENYGPYQIPGQETGSAVPATRYLEALSNRLLLGAANALNSAINRLLPDTSPEQLRESYRPPRKGAQLLDFGCGSDAFLNQARERGWATTGMDFAESTVERVRRSGHRALLVSPSSWDEIEDGSFDFVRMSHVLEHLYHPRATLAKLREKMSAGAVLHVGVPNPGSLTSRLFRSRWWGLECPRHVALYTPRVLRKLLLDSGFVPFKVLHESVTKDFARSLGYLLQDHGRLGGEGVDAMMHHGGVATLSHTPARLAARLGVADRFNVLARKVEGPAPRTRAG